MEPTNSKTYGGKYSIDKDAIKGQLTAFVLTIAATAGLGALNALDLTTVPGWAAGAATYAVTTAIGFLTTYAAKK